MQLSALLAYSTLATLSVAASIPALEARQSTITVSSDTGDAQIEVPATTQGYVLFCLHRLLPPPLLPPLHIAQRSTKI